jgi:hypothetical protein
MTISMEIDGSMNDEVVSYSWQVLTSPLILLTLVMHAVQSSNSDR